MAELIDIPGTAITKSRFLAMVAVVFLCFIAANVGMWIWSTRLRPSEALDNIDHARKANVIVLGNSLLQVAFDSEVFDRTARSESTDLSAVNAAISGTFASEHYLMLERAIRKLPLQTVIVGFFDYQLSMPHTASVADLSGLRAVVFDSRIPAREVEQVYGFGFAERLRYRLFRALPLLAYRATPWFYVALLRIRLGGPFFDMDGPIRGLFNQTAASSENGPVRFNLPTEKVIEECKARQYRLIFVLMPMSPLHAKAFYTQRRWRSHLNSLERLFQRERCGFIDASKWFPSQNQFSDSVHLDSSQRAMFSSILASSVVAELSSMRSRWP